VADTIPDGRRTREPGQENKAPRPRWRSRKTLTWTGTGIAVAATAAVLIAVFAASGPSSPPSSPVTPPTAPGAPLIDPGGTGVSSVAFSPDGSLLAVGDINGTSYLWNSGSATLDGPPMRPGADGEQVGGIAVSSAGMLAVGTDNSGRTAGDITLWNARARKRIMTLSDPGGAGVPGGLAFSTDGIYLVAGDGNGAIYVWDVYMDMPPKTLRDPGTGKVLDVAFQPGTHTFAVADGNGSIYLWDATNGVAAGPPLQDPDGGVLGGVSFSADGTMLAAGDANGNVYIWKVATGRLLQTLHDPQGLQVNDVSFSPDGTAVAVAADNQAQTVSAIRVWILATQQVYTFHDPLATGHDPHAAGARRLAFSPDGSLLAVGDANGNTYLWDMLWLHS